MDEYRTTNITVGLQERKIMRDTSNNVKSLPPVIFQTIPVALSIPISSRGDWMAFNAASLALDFPTEGQGQKYNLWKATTQQTQKD